MQNCGQSYAKRDKVDWQANIYPICVQCNQHTGRKDEGAGTKRSSFESKSIIKQQFHSLPVTTTLQQQLQVRISDWLYVIWVPGAQIDGLGRVRQVDE